MCVARRAARQNDIITARQLATCGLHSWAIDVRVEREQLHRVHRGVYAVGTGVLTTKGTLTAATMACGDGAALAGHGAAAWHEMKPWRKRAVDVIVPRGGGGRRRERRAIRPLRTRVDARDLWHRDGILVTSPARTALDLAAELAPKRLRRMIRQSLAEQRLSIRQLTDIVARYPRHRGARALRTLIADGHVPTRSELEDLALDVLDRAAITRPQVNPRLRLDGRTVKPDLLFRQARLVIELDSKTWHDNPLARADDSDRQALLEAHGYRVLRVTWQQLVTRPRQTLARIRAALSA